ncbi:MAG: hypothetical protein H6737_05445 [Alphaproteobacteria bacterium]|nr:hypothetical protein [Alphaproteobacteria bacterium]
MLRHSLQRELPLEIPALEMVFAEPPSLDGLVVEVEPAREIDEPTMLESWELFVYENSPREAKGVVAEGHEVSLMCVAFEEGRVVPFTARSGLMMRAGDDATLPDLAKSLVGKRVGERYVTKVVVPDDFEQDLLQGKTLDFIVQIESTTEVQEISPGDPACIEKMGLGEDVSLEFLLQKIGEGWMEAQLDQLLDEAEERALDQLIEQTHFEHIPQEAAETELFLRWKHSEGDVLLKLDASEAELAWSWAHWASNEELYGACARNVALALLYRAIAEENGMEASVEDGLAVLSIVAPEIEATAEDVKAELEKNPEIARRALDLGFQKRMRDFVLSHAEVRDPNAQYYADKEADA